MAVRPPSHEEGGNGVGNILFLFCQDGKRDSFRRRRRAYSLFEFPVIFAARGRREKTRKTTLEKYTLNHKGAFCVSQRGRFFLFHFHSKSRMLLAGSYERNERRRTKNKERRKDTPKNGKSPLQTALVNKNGGKGLHGEHRGFFYSRRLRFYLISLCCCCCLARYAHSSALFVLLLRFCSFKALKYSRTRVLCRPICLSFLIK